MARKSTRRVRSAVPQRDDQARMIEPSGSKLRLLLGIIATISTVFALYLFYVYRFEKESDANLVYCLVALGIMVLCLFALRSEPEYSDDTKAAIERQLGGRTIPEVLEIVKGLTHFRDEVAKTFELKEETPQKVLAELKRFRRDTPRPVPEKALPAVKLPKGISEREVKALKDGHTKEIQGLGRKLHEAERQLEQAREEAKRKLDQAQKDYEAKLKTLASEHQTALIQKGQASDELLRASLEEAGRTRDAAIARLNSDATTHLEGVVRGYTEQIATLEEAVRAAALVVPVTTEKVTEKVVERVVVQKIIDPATSQELERSVREVQKLKADLTRSDGERRTFEILKGQAGKLLAVAQGENVTLKDQIVALTAQLEAAPLSEAIVKNAAETLDRVASRFWFFRSVSRMVRLIGNDDAVLFEILTRAKAELEEFLEVITIGNPKEKEVLEALIGGKIPEAVWEYYLERVHKVGNINSELFLARALRQVVIYGTSLDAYLEPSEKHLTPVITRTFEGTLSAVEGTRASEFKSGRRRGRGRGKRNRQHRDEGDVVQE